MRRNIAGKRFGKLLVIREAVFYEKPYAKRPGRHWVVQCDCGTRLVRQAISFMYGLSQSCGCSKHGPAFNRLPFGEAAKNAAYSQMKLHVARSRKGKRQVSWDLTVKQFIAITSKPCRYCGIETSKEIGSRKGNGSTYGSYKYNGIDRIDSSKGYILGNCAPCCKSCNFAKNDQTEEAFKSWLKKAYTHYVLQGKYAKA